MNRYFLFLFVALSCAAQSSAQPASSKAFLQKLDALADSVSAASSPDNKDYKRLESANARLRNWLLKEGAAHPEWLQVGPVNFERGAVCVLTSADRRFRIYWWDTETGGTMHFYAGVIQYLAAPGRAGTLDLDDKRTMEDGGSPGYWYDELYSVTTKSGNTFYLPVYGADYSTRDKASGIRAYTIRAGKLRGDVPFFFTKTKQYSDISYNYDFFKYAGREEGLPQLTYLEKEREVVIPVVTKDNTITDRVLVYRFDGERFVYVQAK